MHRYFAGAFSADGLCLFPLSGRLYTVPGNFCEHNLCILVCDIILQKCIFAFLAASVQTINRTEKYLCGQFLRPAENSWKHKNFLYYSTRSIQYSYRLMYSVFNELQMKDWKEAIESIGFQRCCYEKKDHIHCMAFRKIADIDNYSCLEDKSSLLYIPQDFNTKLSEEPDEVAPKKKRKTTPDSI